MQIFMRGAICRVEYSCGCGAGCPRSGPGKAAFLSPSLFWHADKEQQGKEARRRQSQGLPWSSPQTSRHWEKRAREKIHFHTLLHTFPLVVADVLNKNPAYLTGGRASLSDWLRHIALTWQAEVRSGFRSRGFKLEWQRMCCHRTVIYQSLSLRQSMISAHDYVIESTCKDMLDGDPSAWRRPYALPSHWVWNALQNILHLRMCVYMCVCVG